ncbi:hypothetical protein [Hymenobacter nivis]|uniref:hypothetical protein n=1 Tax=Hymenobacter nivis TaxID=1850093 RepID=UPI00112DF5D7|nr:hypothetical protein [Hymenobacter nivis]
MRLDIIPDNEGNGEYLVVSGEVERASAVQHLLDRHMTIGVLLKTRLLKNRGVITHENEQQAVMILAKQASREWPEVLTEMKSEPVPEYLIGLLSAENKKAQLRLLKGATINSKQLQAFILEAEQRGFTYSRYLEKHLPSGVNSSELPRFIEQQADGSIKAAGQTSMSEGQLKQVLDQRKAIVATILDKGDDWHCFFATYRGLAGKENYKEGQGGQPHFHYISSKWGSVTRQQIIDGAKSGNYVATSVHIDFLDYRLGVDSIQQDNIMTLPPQPLTGTGLSEPAWLGTNGSLYAHHYAPNASAAACGRYNTVAQVRAAWTNRVTSSKARCPSCERRLQSV